MDELRLIASCQGGQLADFDPLYRKYVNQVFGFVYRRTMNRQLAEDLVSVTFMKALEKIHTYSAKKGPFVAWLYRIARNTLTDHYRKKRDAMNIEDVWDLSSDEIVSNDVADRMNFDKIKEALKGLDPLKRDIILMRVWDGLSYREIGEIIGKSEDNCKVIYSRTIKDLRLHVPLAIVFLFLLSPRM